MPDTKPPSLVYYDFPTSPFCAKVKSVLMYQRAEFKTVSAMAPRQWLALRRHGIGKVPALDVGGRLVVDSTDICHALNGLFPTRPVLPSDPRERALCHAIEEWCDESLYFIGLQKVWLDPANGQSVKAALYAQSGTLLKTAWFRHYKPALGQLRPTETIIIDGLNPQLVTVIQSQDHQAMDVPAQWLQRQALESFNGR